MLSEILKIIPKLDNKDLQEMEKRLQSRFTRIAKKFGAGIAGIFKGGVIGGAALALIDKILNPLKETQEAIDRVLKSSDDLATNAKQFETTTGKLFKLAKIAQSTGLNQDNLFLLLTKFQTAVAQAKNNPNDPMVSSVKNYTDQADIADAFFGFIQELQKMDKSQQVLVQEQVFGEKQILKMADFLQTNFPKQLKEIGLDKLPTELLTKSIEKTASLSDLTYVLSAKRDAKDVIVKSKVITEDMIRQKDKSEQIALNRENARIQSYNDLAAISQTTAKITLLIENGIAMLGSFITTVTPAIQNMVTLLEKVLKMPFLRGIKGLFGGGD